MNVFEFFKKQDTSYCEFLKKEGLLSDEIFYKYDVALFEAYTRKIGDFKLPNKDAEEFGSILNGSEALSAIKVSSSESLESSSIVQFWQLDVVTEFQMFLDVINVTKVNTFPCTILAKGLGVQSFVSRWGHSFDDKLYAIREREGEFELCISSNMLINALGVK